MARHAVAAFGVSSDSGDRDVGAYALYFVITGETDAVAQRKWTYYREGADLEAIAYMTGQATALMAAQTTLDASGSAGAIVTQMQNAFALNIGKVVGSHTTVAKQLDALAAIDGLKGVMCIFDDFEAGTEDFGRKHTSARHAGMLLLCDTQLPLQRVQEDRATGLAGWCIFVGPR
jgi:pyrimidine oxygenase